MTSPPTVSGCLPRRSHLSSTDATATILGVTAAGGLRGCEVDITFTSMAVSYQAAPDVAPETHIRLVRYRSQDFSRLTDVDRLVMQRFNHPTPPNRIAVGREQQQYAGPSAGFKLD